MRRGAVVSLVAAGALSGCASHPQWHVPFTANATAQTNSAPFQWDPHRQYYDQLHKRYYYYDPDRHAYFWENGQPKS